MSLEDDLPDSWGVIRADEDELLTGTLRHKFLEINISVNDLDPDEFDYDIDSDSFYSIFVQWGAEVGMIDDNFEPEDWITSRDDARNWALALAAQIDQQYIPPNNDLVARAKAAAVGDDPGQPRSGSVSDAPTCPVCDSPLYHFRGFNAHDQALNHLEYMDDEEHEGWEISLE